MSEIFEKTLASLPGLLNSTLSGNGQLPSRSFQSFIKTFSNIGSKYEEEQFIKKELNYQKQKMSQPDVSLVNKKESLVRLVYCHMLGYDVSFGIIHAVKLAQQGSILEKRVGYLICGMFLNENHELIMLLVNTIQKDLCSSNILENCAALNATRQLLSTEMIPSMLPLVLKKLSHPREMVRKRAVMCLHRFLQQAPDMVQHLRKEFQTALSDKDPSVMWATLHIYIELVQTDPAPYTRLVPGLVNILQQVCGRGLHTDYDYHTVPAPWLTIQLLCLLRKLAAGNQQLSQQVYPVLIDLMQKTEPNHKMGLAVIYECLETVTMLYPEPRLLQLSADCVARFLSANTINLKYLGLKALTSIVLVDPRYAADHQDTVIDCLEHTDPTVSRKTLDLLYNMANPVNVRVICSKMLDQLTVTTEPEAKAYIVHRITDLTHRFSENVDWYIDTMNQVFLVAENLINDSEVDGFIHLLAENTKNDTSVSGDMKQHAVRTYWKMVQKETLPGSVIQVAAWVLGEFGALSENPHPSDMVTYLCKWYGRCRDIRPRSLILSAFLKLGDHVADKTELLDLLGTETHSENKELAQRALELKNIHNHGIQISSCNPIKIDLSFSFLDEYVTAALERGEEPYKPITSRHPLSQVQQKTDNISLFAGLNFAPYQHKSSTGSQDSGSSPFTVLKQKSSGDTNSINYSEIGGGSLKTDGVKNVWKKQSEEEMVVGESSMHITEDMSISQSTLGLTDQKESYDVLSEKGNVTDEDGRKKKLAVQLFSGLVSPCSERNPQELKSAHFKTENKTAGPSATGKRNLSDHNFSSNSSCSSSSNFDLACLQNDTFEKCIGGDSIYKPDGTLLSQDLNKSYANCSDEAKVTADDLLIESNFIDSLQSTSSNDHKDFSMSVDGTDKISTFEDDTVSFEQDSIDGDVNKTYFTDAELSPERCRHIQQRGTKHSKSVSSPNKAPYSTVSVSSDKSFCVSCSPSNNLHALRLLPSNLQQSSHEDQPTMIFKNSSIEIYCQKVWQSDFTTLCLCLIASPDLSDVHGQTSHHTIMSFLSSKVKLKMSMESSEQWKQELVASLDSDKKMMSLDVILVEEDVTRTHYSVTLDISSHGEADIFKVSLQLPISDFIRPFPIDLEEYGRLWINCGEEDEVTITKSHMSLDKQLNAALIDHSGNEELMFGRLSYQENTFIMLHCVRQPERAGKYPTTLIKLRSKNKQLLHCIKQFLIMLSH